MDKNEKIAREAMTIFETGDMSTIERLTDPEFIEYTPDPTFQSDKKGIEFVKEVVTNFRNTFSDIKIEIKDVICNNEKAVVYSVFKGRQTGMMNDIAPTGREIAFDNIDILEIKDGKVSGHWGLADNLGLLMQLGVLSEAEMHPH